MAVLDAAVRTVHLLFAGVWAGSVVFFAWAVLPTAGDGDANPGPIERTLGRFTTLSRTSALLLFVTGGHMAATGYTAASLLGTPRGHAVLGMVALWLVLTGLVEAGASKMGDGLDEGKVRTPAKEGGPYLKAAAVVAVLLLLDAGFVTGMA